MPASGDLKDLYADTYGNILYGFNSYSDGALLASSTHGDSWYDVTGNLCTPFIPYPSGIGQNDQGYYFVTCGISAFWRSLTTSSIVGIEPITLTDKQTMSVYPNPSIDFCNIVVDNLKEEGTLTFKDIHGKILHSYSISSNHLPLQIDVSSFPDGIYLIEFSCGKWTGISKFMKP